MIDPKPATPAPATQGKTSGRKRRFGGTEAQIRSALKFYNHYGWKLF